jgi:hypothetical protein
MSALPVVTALALIFATTASADEWHKHWGVSGSPELRVYTNDAAITVEAAGDGAIDASLITRGFTIGSTGVQVTEHQSGNAVDINVKVPSMHFSFGDHSVELRVRVPQKLSAEVHTGDGSVKLYGLHGTLRADSGDGSVRGEQLDGSLEARSGDGSVHVDGRFDHLVLHTGDGSVAVNALRGSRVVTDWKLETNDGSVRLVVPRDLAADVELSTGDGSIHSDLPLTIEGKHIGRQMSGKLNGGGPLLRVRTGDGSITISSI